MIETGAIALPERLAEWPRIAAVVRPDGTGSITVNGTEKPCAADGVEALRTGVIARCVGIAARLRRPVKLSVSDVDNAWTLAVRPEGIVQLVDAGGALEPATGLAAHEGRCRQCHRLQPVTSIRCEQCGIDEPHRVEQEWFDAAGVVPDAMTVQPMSDEPDPSAEQALTEAPRTEPSVQLPWGRPALRLTFSSGHALDVVENVAVGRNPVATDGRVPVAIPSPERRLSRTHLFIDLDAAGRILVTDNGGGNGTEAQTDPPRRLEPFVPYVVEPGTTLVLGDVTLTITFAATH